MKWTLRKLCVANLVFAILIVWGYIVYGLLAGLPINEHFLGEGPFRWRHSSAGAWAWVVPALMECIIVIGFFLGKRFEEDLSGHHVFCGLVGAFFLVHLLFMYIGTLFGEYFSVSGQKPDLFPFPAQAWLGVYVWSSHLLYGIQGLIPAESRRERELKRFEEWMRRQDEK